MIERHLAKQIKRYARQYPVITLTGPRQSGKTTLCQKLFNKHTYYSLEDLDIRQQAKQDPRAFLQRCSRKGAVLDEIQRVPELTSYIQGIVDEHKKNGMFILTGSQNFQVIDTVSQSLAGRTALATLLPFSFSEVYDKKCPSLDKLLLMGFYPRIHDKKLKPADMLSFYINTYLERDMRALLNVKDLGQFEVFLKLCAARTGQVLNMSNLANDCGVNHNTIKSWLSVLEASYIIHLVRPHHRNFRKRLIKSPKLYFIDVGLAAYLLDIIKVEHMANHPLRGALFETFVVAEILKMRFNNGQRSNLYYFRDNVGNEVDLILDYGTDVIAIEIKSGKTMNASFLKGLHYYKKLNKRHVKQSILIYGGEDAYKYLECDVMGYKNIASVKI